MAKDWFISPQATPDITPPKSVAPKIGERFAPFNPEHLSPQQNSSLQSFFVPGWQGESLISKDVKIFKEILGKFHADAKKFFCRKEELSRRIKISIYDEFLSYAEELAINCTELDHYTKLWNELGNENSQYHDELSKFVNVLSFRIASIYLLKVRFILIIQQESNLEFDIKSIFYPNAYLTKIFKIASSTELKTKAFDQNVFSWYRPNEELKNDLLRFKSICSAIKISDIMKVFAIKSERILNEKSDFSHTLSHKRFGLFLNNLIINFPIWKESISGRNKFAVQEQFEILSTKFTGDYLESMALSHWLAQQSNQHIKWEQIICPDFKNFGFKTGLFLKNVHTLQFLTFLAQIAKQQGQTPVNFVSKIINSNLSNRKDSNEQQRHLLINESATHSTYDRIVLNLTNFPKNNPQHFLFSKIQEQKNFLKDGGFLYVLTSKKLFVPSQKGKIENLLKDFKVESMFSLSDIKGKGEIGSFIYVFSLQDPFYNSSLKHNCLNFRLDGQLNTFQEFSIFTELVQEFFNKNFLDLPPMYQKNAEDFRLEFFQDAIVNGQLIHSTTKDSNKITHPLFFKKLMNLCNSLDYFFDIQHVNFSHNIEEDSLFNFSHSFKREEAEFTIIVDQRIKEQTKIEIIPTSTLEAKSYEYGHALCSYFYIYPKWSNLNFHLLKDYLESTIGTQIINLTFNNEIRKIKGNLNKLLIPKFFLSNNELPEHIKAGLSFLSLNPQKIISYHPSEINKIFAQIKNILPSLAKSYPRDTLELVSTFKRSITKCSQLLGNSTKIGHFNFNNPILKSPLLLSKTYPIYPDNKDIYIEFNTDVLEKIHRPLEKVKIKTNESNNSYIELMADDQVIVTLYSDDAMVQFLSYLFDNVIGHPLSKILQGIQAPRIDDLKSILQSYQTLQNCIKEIESTLLKEFDRLINSTILESK